MSSLQCPGLRAEMPHHWLAAVGATVLVDGMHLSWTGGLNPYAVLHHEEAPLDALVASWPTRQRIEDMPMVACARRSSLKNLTRNDFRQLLKDSRWRTDAWTVSSAATDLTGTVEGGAVTLGPLTPVLEQGASAHRNLPYVSDCTPEKIANTLTGRAARERGAGLGIDPERFTNATTGSKGVATLHAVETLTYFGLALFPVRGDGIHHSKRPFKARQRGWTTHLYKLGFFQWPAWPQPLDRYGIDALIDVWQPERGSTDNLLGIHSAWQSVVRKARPGGKNPTFGYSSRRLTG